MSAAVQPGERASRSAFFRQSGWMVMATFIGGACLFAVHGLVPFLGPAEYSLFGALLAIINILGIPSTGLQYTFAQQTAAVRNPADEARLVGTVRTLLKWTFGLWIGFVLMVLLARHQILSGLTITNPMALWLVMLIGLGSLWQPILNGVLQGRQNFLWMGWVAIIGGAGRLVAAAIIVIVLHGKATGAITGAWLSMAAVVLILIYQTRAVWGAKDRLPIQWQPWLADVVPFTIGLGTWQFIWSVDVIFVRALFLQPETGYYVMAGTMARGLVTFTTPIVAVMLPKVVQSLAHGKRSNVLLYTLLTAGGLGVLGAVFCTGLAFALKQLVVNGWGAGVLPAWVVNKVQVNRDGFLLLAQLLPWFVWSMVPLTLSNVLLQNQLARKQYRIVLYLVLTVAAYAAGLVMFGHSFVRVVQVVGVFNLIYLAVLVLFLQPWRQREADGSAFQK